MTAPPGVEVSSPTHVVHMSEPHVRYRHIEGYPGTVTATDYQLTVTVQPPIEGDAYNTVVAAAEASWNRSGMTVDSGVRVHFLGRQMLNEATGLPLENGETADPDLSGNEGTVVRLSVYRMNDPSLAGYLGRFSAELVRLAGMPDEERTYTYRSVVVGRAG